MLDRAVSSESTEAAVGRRRRRRLDRFSEPKTKDNWNHSRAISVSLNQSRRLRTRPPFPKHHQTSSIPSSFLSSSCVTWQTMVSVCVCVIPRWNSTHLRVTGDELVTWPRSMVRLAASRPLTSRRSKQVCFSRAAGGVREEGEGLVRVDPRQRLSWEGLAHSSRPGLAVSSAGAACLVRVPARALRCQFACRDLAASIGLMRNCAPGPLCRRFRRC